MVGAGLATEAAEAVADYAFDELGFAELLASTDPPNLASIRVMERLGMRSRGRPASGHPLVFYRIGRHRVDGGAAARAATAHTP